MVVAINQQHAAIWVCAGIVGVFEGIARAVDAGALAVPDAEHTIDLTARHKIELLRSPHRGCRQILVETGLEENIVLAQVRGGLPQRAIITTQWRAAIAGDEPGSVEPLGAVALALHDRQTYHSLYARQEHSPTGSRVLVFQAYFGKTVAIHISVLCPRWRTAALLSPRRSVVNRARCGHSPCLGSAMRLARASRARFVAPGKPLNAAATLIGTAHAGRADPQLVPRR